MSLMFTFNLTRAKSYDLDDVEMEVSSVYRDMCSEAIAFSSLPIARKLSSVKEITAELVQ